MTDETAGTNKNASDSASDPNAQQDLQQTLNGLNAEQRATWRMKGTLPDKPPTTEAPAASNKKDESSADEGDVNESDADAETATVPETAKQEQRRKPPAEDRVKELLAERRKDQYRIQELEAKLSKPPESPASAAEKTEAKPAAAAQVPKTPKPKATDLDANGKAKYATWEEYEDARDEWTRETLREEVRAEHEKSVQKAEQDKQQQQLADTWKGRVDEAIKKHDDFAEVAFDPKLQIPVGSATDAFILDSELGAEVLYHFGKHPAELARITAIKSPLAQIRELMKLEIKLSGDTSSETSKSSATSNGEKEVKAEAKAPIPKITTAPKPPSEVGGRGTAPEDEIAAAVEAENFRTFKRLEDARDARKFKAS
jgi:hypothetical protein